MKPHNARTKKNLKREITLEVSVENLVGSHINLENPKRPLYHFFSQKPRNALSDYKGP